MVFSSYRNAAVSLLTAAVLASGFGVLVSPSQPAFAQEASGGASGGGAIQGGDGVPGGGVGIPGSLQNGSTAWGIGETATPDEHGYADDGDDRGYVARSGRRHPAY